MQLAVEFLLLVILLSSLSIAGRSQKDFVSIDCGYDGLSNCWVSDSQITYCGDEPYIDGGNNQNVSADADLNGLHEFYRTLRSFPDGKRNCYTLGSLQRGRKYLIRAEFMYGNFDGLNRPPSFDVYLGVHFWDSVRPVNFSRLEIITVSLSESVQVCLVNKGSGTPYITVLELRPLNNSMYPLANSSHALVLRGDRIDYGGKEDSSTRYPADPFDRIWFAPRREQNWVPLNTSESMIKDEDMEYRIPAVVLGTAVTTGNTSERLEFNVTALQGEDTHVMMHFADIGIFGNNQVREFNVSANGTQLSAQYKPSNLSLSTLYANSFGKGGTTTYSLRASQKSTLPPIINALEILVLVQLSGGLSTEENDVNAITKIKEAYKISNWQGDPCVPKEFTWEGLNCSYNSSLNPRIVSLNLYGKRLEGGISPYIANLTALVSLDLSYNNLTGGIPDELAQLPELNFLNLTKNRLNGQVPYALRDKSQKKMLSLSIDGNTNLCLTIGSCQPKRNSNKIIIPTVVSVSVSFLLFLIMMIIWRIKKRQKYCHGASRKVKHNLYSESHQFTYEDIVHMTKNFQQQVGKGGFAIVYRGQLKTGREVAVKMISKTSPQKAKEFEAEARMLMRVHHRNIVSFIGYCSDPDNIALVYEFMAYGSLAKHLSDKNANDLSWNTRLKIALDVAQGLDYLHTSCKPPIFHRDVKTTNILLSQSFEAKLVNFGLSRLFEDNELSDLSTTMASTHGYLDPEYYQNSTLNDKSDVYSFGIVLLELITGRPPIMDGLQKISIVSWVKLKIERGDATAIVDERLQGDCDFSSLWKVIDIAIACTNSCSRERPSMSNVFLELKEAVSSLSSQGSPGKVESQERRLIVEFPVSRHENEDPLSR